jgi:hypothetical protein
VNPLMGFFARSLPSPRAHQIPRVLAMTESPPTPHPAPARLRHSRSDVLRRAATLDDTISALAAQLAAYPAGRRGRQLAAGAREQAGAGPRLGSRAWGPRGAIVRGAKPGQPDPSSPATPDCWDRASRVRWVHTLARWRI